MDPLPTAEDVLEAELAAAIEATLSHKVRARTAAPPPITAAEAQWRLVGGCVGWEGGWQGLECW